MKRVCCFVVLSLLFLSGVMCSVGAAPDSEAGSKSSKFIHFIADGPSHGYGEHDYVAGSMLLARRLENTLSGIRTTVHPDGWPDDSSVLDGADAIVLFTDGGKGKHPVLDHLEEMDRLAEKGVGIVAIHWSLKVPKGKPGEYFHDWFGGYYEAGFSRNPKWTPAFSDLPDHPITRGVSPFQIHDEWYHRMRFREDRKGIIPILKDVPPEQSSDGVVAWTTVRDNGGRSFGFTGAHYHKNWAHDQFQRIVLNAIAWTAHVPVPENGVSSDTPTVRELEVNHSEEGEYNRAKLRKQIRSWNR